MSGSQFAPSIHLLALIWLKSLWLGFWMACGSALQWTLFVGTDGATRRKGWHDRAGHPHCHVRPDCSVCLPRESWCTGTHSPFAKAQLIKKKKGSLHWKKRGEPSPAFNTNSLWKETNMVQRTGILLMSLSFRNDGPLCCSGWSE